MAAVSPSSSTVSKASPSSPFELAIQQFLATLKDKDKSKNPFLVELKAQGQYEGKTPRAGPQSQASAADLTQFVEESIAQKRTTRTIRILECVKPFIEALKNLMEVCEKTLQAAPFGVSIAFTGARIVLGLAIKLDYLDTIVDGMTEIRNSLKCYEMLADAFETSLDIQNLLVASYEKIIKFWYNISGILSSRMVKTLMKIMVTKPIDQEIKTAREGLKNDGDSLMLLTAATRSQQRKKENDAARRQAITKWIVHNSPVDVRNNLNEQVALHQKGTCQWILQDPRFQDWFMSKQNAVLWYNAKPGSGKSVLAATIIQHLKDAGKKVAHFFYSFNDRRRKHGITGLRSLALQLSNFLEVLPEKLAQRYREEVANHVDGVANLETAVDVFHELLRCDEVYIIVDGIDECRDEKAILLSFKQLIAMRSYSTVKWMFTSRNHDEIRNTMQSLNAVEIAAETAVISNDIRKYFLERHPDQTKFIEDWTDGEDNFLYTKLMCDIMAGEGLTSAAEIEDALNSYPKNLNGLYVRVLVKLSEKSEQKQEMARRIFLTLIGAAQSISLIEVSNLLAISPGADDYNENRVPFDQAMRDLCSPLVVFCAPKDGDTPDNPLVALCHKTVEDFFMQNPADISSETGLTPDLHQFFVTPRLAGERIGLDCLTYLQYARYQKPDFDLSKVLLRPVAKEHAFLPYAATFWADHLDLSTTHLPADKVRDAVERFLRSPAFWTCLSAQMIVSPYLFGSYSSSSRGSRYFKMGVKARSRSQQSRVGLPLPCWLDSSDQGKALESSLCLFAEEWREVLLTCPGGLDLCPRLMRSEPSCHLTPLRAVKTVRVAHLEDHLRAVCPTGRASFLDLTFRGKTLWASLVCFQTEGKIERLQIPLFSKQTPQSDGHHLPIDPAEMTKWNTAVLRNEGQAETVQAWKVDPQSLSVKRITNDCSTEHKTPLAFSKQHIGRRRGAWEKVSIQDLAPHAATGTKHLQVIHMAWIAERSKSLGQPRKAADDQESEETSEEDSNDDSTSEASDSSDDDDDDDDDGQADSDDVSDTSGSAKDGPAKETSDTDYDDSEAEDGFITDCLIVTSVDGQPSWYPWSHPGRVWSRIGGAPHPTLPILVVSHTAREIQVIDLIKRTKETKHLPEATDLDEDPVASLRELRFSPCGNYLHFLSVSFFAQKASTITESRITASTFSFDPEGGSDRTLLRECQARKCTYSFGETLRDISPPLVLTHWSDREVLLALPPLTCDPRILKIKLPQVNVASGRIAEECGDGDEESSSIWTLRNPVYFPTSTPRRNARLMHREAKGGDDKDCSYVFLALDTCVPGDAMPAKANAAETFPAANEQSSDDASTSAAVAASQSESSPELPVVSPPVVLRWKVAPGEGEGWQAWDPKVDGQASDLKRGLPIEKLLQGSFVDPDKLFSVSTRGGLNWKRKGHLSCATFG